MSSKEHLMCLEPCPCTQTFIVSLVPFNRLSIWIDIIKYFLNIRHLFFRLQLRFCSLVMSFLSSQCKFHPFYHTILFYFINVINFLERYMLIYFIITSEHCWPEGKYQNSKDSHTFLKYLKELILLSRYSRYFQGKKG